MSDWETWRGENWTLINSKWQHCPPDEVDVVISDPPYNDRTSLGARSAKNKNVVSDISDSSSGISRHTITSFMGIKPKEVGPALIERSKGWVVLFCALEQLGEYEIAVGVKRYIRSGFWRKTNPTPQFTGDRPAQWGEGIAYMGAHDRDLYGEAMAIMHRPGRKVWNAGGHPCYLEGPTTRSESGTDVRFHETQKPLWIMLELIERFTQPGDLVWDPYAGSCTTGVACIRLGRRFLGHEMQRQYAEQSAERLTAEENGINLKAARAGQMGLFSANDLSSENDD